MSDFHSAPGWKQYADTALGDAGNYWQRDDGEVEIMQIGPGLPNTHPSVDGQVGFLAKRTHQAGWWFQDEYIGIWRTFEEAREAADQVVAHD